MKPSELLRKKGWCQGDFRDAHGCFCCYGAIDHLGLLGDRRTTNLRKHLEGQRGGGIVLWNDKPERTAEEVIAKLEEFGL